MNEREHRPQNSRRANQDEGEIARYERYRYGGDRATPQYNDIGSNWSIEQLINDPLDVLYDPEEDEITTEAVTSFTEGESVQEDGGKRDGSRVPQSSQPKMAWELDDFTRGDPLDDEWDYTDEWLNKTQVASNHLNAGWSEIGNKDNYNGIDTSNWKTPDGRDLPLEEKQQIASVYQGSTIPGFVIASYGALGSRALWRAFGQIVARRFGERAAFAATINAGDPISPVAELLTLGLGVITIYQIYRAWDDIWGEVEQELDNPNSEIVVTQEPENQVYTTPNEERRGIEHTGSVPPQVETQTPPFDTEAGRETVEGQNHTGNTSQQEVDWDNYIFESQVDQDFSNPEVRRRDEIAHGGYYSRKNFRKLIQEASISTHGEKHLKAKTEEEARQLSYKQAQYLPGINNGALEKEALLNGEYLLERDGGAFWNFYRSNDYVGYDQGVKTRWIRAEYSSQTVHGHPINPKRLGKYVKNPTP